VELSWSTFVLEIINFLVLVWILKRFLYKPVLEVIARRRDGIEKIRVDAAALQTNAEKLQKQYESRLADWNAERQQARDALAHELEAERARKQSEMQVALQQEAEKARVAQQRRQADTVREIEEAALNQAATFAARLLEKGAGPETQSRLVGLLIDELIALPDERAATIRNGFNAAPGNIEVVSAFELADDVRDRLTQALQKLCDSKIPLHFAVNGELLAGVRITVGAWVLAANIRDELTGFAELAHAS